MAKATSSKTDPAQRERFIKAARELGADEDEAAFKAKLAVIARQRPKDEPSVAGAASDGDES